MTFNLSTLLGGALLYLFVLFAIAYATERGWIPERIVRHRLMYVLSLGVYATAWSYYGSLSFAATQGFVFLTVYIGPTLAFILTPLLLAPLLRLIRDYQLTSLADLFAFRYSSQLAGVLVSLFTLLGALPYIALQIRAVSESINVLTQDKAPQQVGLIFCIALVVFAVLFGARHISPRQKHEGLVVSIAFESVVKLAAILIIALFAVFEVFGGPAGLNDWLHTSPDMLQALYSPVQEGPWLTLLLLAFAAAFLLPGQFHMGFVENFDEHSLALAGWGFPLFLLLFSLAIPPIFWAGHQLIPDANTDYYILSIPLHERRPALAMLAFLGGISAASAMVIVTTLALAQMMLNHVLLPASYPDPAVDMYRWLLWGRRMLIGLIIIASYGLHLLLEQHASLTELVLISFVAVVQFLPGLIGVLFWRRATRPGFLLGLLAGALVWYATLLMPLLQQAHILQSEFNFQEFLSATNQDVWEFSTFWSLSLNALLFVAVSLITRHDPGERRAVAACFRDQVFYPTRKGPINAASPQQFSEQLGRIIGTSTASQEVAKALKDLNMDPAERNPRQLQRLRDRIERNLSGMIGPMLARMIVDSRLQIDEDTRTVLADHIHFVEEQLERSRSQLDGLARELDELRRYHRQILMDLPLGACSMSTEQEILTWNQAMERLSGISAPMAVGCRVQELPAPWASLLAEFLLLQGNHIYKTRITFNSRACWFNLHKAPISTSLSFQVAEQGYVWDGVVVLIEDLTELQTLEAELVHSERLASIGRLAAGVAHEIGNPVTGIACLAQNLQDETNPQVIAESLDDILQQTQRISAIQQTLITFSHSGPPEGQRYSRFKLSACIAAAQHLVTLSHKAEFFDYVELCDEEILVEGDPQRLQQVFVNLFNNALDASPADGRVQVSAAVTTEEVEVTVSDQGIGIPREWQERVFEPFFTTKDPGKGTGLGLSVVYNIVHNHGGSIKINSQPGVGTQVMVCLPLRQSAHGETPFAT
ncbi:MAG: ATP-binding protein [Candidatus Competibacteraceae bacterium]|jgi:Na+/proline symporter/signal transduction histidine kinase|nr:ATP-binding protein [Candidatus Competibacteraceae bacterium]